MFVTVRVALTLAGWLAALSSRAHCTTRVWAHARGHKTATFKVMQEDEGAHPEFVGDSVRCVTKFRLTASRNDRALLERRVSGTEAQCTADFDTPSSRCGDWRLETVSNSRVAISWFPHR
jgi:hypothetical protein